MHVDLIAYTPEPERIVATAARLCYSSLDASQLVQDLSEKQIENLLNIVISGGHLSTLEHAVFTFSISGVSRSLTHQLVRHRIASYNQQSQRYVKFDKDSIETVLPDSIDNSDATFELFENCMQTCAKTYENLLNLGIPAEDARYVLPNAATTNIIVTMNARELRHFFNVRCCNRAQREIRTLAWMMLNCVKSVAPKLFETAGPDCVLSSCKEGKMTCGHPYPKVKLQ